MLEGFLKMTNYPILLDGATGTNLIKAGMKASDRVADFILNNPHIMLNLQESYIEAGSRLIPTPTFGVNKVKYGNDFLNITKKLAEISVCAVSNSREKVLLAGELSPCGLFLPPMGNASFDDIYNAYKEQAEVLFDCGVQAFYLITIFSLEELRIAILALKENFNLPIFASVTIDKNGKTMTGNDALCCAKITESMGIFATGFNCSVGSPLLLPYIEKTREILGIPLIAKPNAGINFSEYQNPESFAEEAILLVDAGADYIGGCCGTGPLHIKALSEKIKSKQFNKTSNSQNKTKQLCCTSKNIFELDENIKLSSPFSAEAFLDDFDPDEINKNSDNAIGDIQAALIDLDSEEDVDLLSENTFSIKFPVAVRSENTELLEKCARNYCGNLIIVSNNLLNSEKENFKSKYGSIIYEN